MQQFRDDDDDQQQPTAAGAAVQVLGGLAARLVDTAIAAGAAKPRSRAPKGAPGSPASGGCKPCQAYGRVFDAQQAAKALRKNVLGGGGAGR